jgi:hypothetical protein
METNEKELDAEETLEEPEEILDEGGTDTTDWKAETLKRHGIAKRYQTKNQKLKEEFEVYKTAHPDEKVGQPQDKKEFDLAEKSYLLANGIKKEEISFVFEEMKKTGKSMDEILDSKYFQQQLAEKRELAATEAAIPSGTNRGGNATRDKVDYWIAKDELPPADQVELRRKVVNAKIEREKSVSKFTDTPVVK